MGGFTPRDWFDVASAILLVVLTAILVFKQDTAVDIHTTGLSFTRG